MNQPKKALFAVLLMLTAAAAQAQTAVTVSSITSTLVTSLTTALGDIISGVAPLLALGFGIAAAVRWARKGVKAAG